MNDRHPTEDDKALGRLMADMRRSGGWHSRFVSAARARARRTGETMRVVCLTVRGMEWIACHPDGTCERAEVSPCN